MNNTNQPEPEPKVVSSAILSEETVASILGEPEMPDKEYIEYLEKFIEALIETNTFGHQAIQSFIELLGFIGENFGDTADFPIRVDNDFYEGLFSEKLSKCQSQIEQFLDAYSETNVDDEPQLSDEEVF